MNASIWRTLTVWLVVTATTATVGWWCLGVPTPSGDSFEALVARGAAILLAGCAGWAWLVTTTVLVSEALGAARAPGVPAWARRTVLAACGMALLGASPAIASPTTPSHPVDPDVGVLVGLQLPDRTTGPAHRRADDAGSVTSPAWSADYAAGTPLLVRPGDSLWLVATGLLPAGTSTAEVAGLTDRLYALNRAVIGDDPDLITPGQLLRTPRGLRTDR